MNLYMYTLRIWEWICMYTENIWGMSFFRYCIWRMRGMRWILNRILLFVFAEYVEWICLYNENTLNESACILRIRKTNLYVYWEYVECTKNWISRKILNQNHNYFRMFIRGPDGFIWPFTLSDSRKGRLEGFWKGERLESDKKRKLGGGMDSEISTYWPSENHHDGKSGTGGKNGELRWRGDKGGEHVNTLFENMLKGKMYCMVPRRLRREQGNKRRYCGIGDKSGCDWLVDIVRISWWHDIIRHKERRPFGHLKAKASCLAADIFCNRYLERERMSGRRLERGGKRRRLEWRYTDSRQIGWSTGGNWI